jgi:hypothetical protein
MFALYSQGESPTLSTAQAAKMMTRLVNTYACSLHVRARRRLVRADLAHT